jgi:hypothetical protein
MVSKTIFDYVQNKKYIPNYIVTSFIIQDTQFKEHFFDKIYQKSIVLQNMVQE